LIIHASIPYNMPTLKFRYLTDIDIENFIYSRWWYLIVCWFPCSDYCASCYWS